MKSVDIMKIYEPKNLCESVAIFSDNSNLSNWKLVYDRCEDEEMTLAEVCNQLGRKIKIIPER